MIRLGEGASTTNRVRRGSAGWAGIWAAFLAAGVLSACGGAAPRPSENPFGDGEGATRGAIHLTVVNTWGTPAEVTVLRSGERTPLGTVQGRSRQMYRVPWPVPTSHLRVEIRIQGGGSYTTPGIEAYQGERYGLRIERDLRASRLRR